MNIAQQECLLNSVCEENIKLKEEIKTLKQELEVLKTSKKTIHSRKLERALELHKLIEVII